MRARILRTILILACLPSIATAETVTTTPLKTYGLGALNCAIYSADGGSIFGASLQNVIYQIDASSGAIRRRFHGHTNHIRSLAVTGNGKYLLSGGKDSAVRVWEIATGKLLKIFQESTYQIYNLAVSNDGRRILTITGNVRVWDSPTESKLLLERMPIANERAAGAFSKDGSMVLAGAGDGTIRVWNAATGALLYTFNDHSGAVYSAVFSPDGKQVLSGGADKSVVLHDLASGEVTGYFTGHNDTVNAVAFSPGGSQIMSASDDRTIRIWKVATSKVSRIITCNDKVSGAAYSPDGKTIMSHHVMDLSIRQWNTGSGPNPPSFYHFANKIRTVGFSAAGNIVLTGGDDRIVRLWDAASEIPIRGFSGHTGPITEAAISPDGTRVVSCASDGRTILWNANDGTSISIFSVPQVTMERVYTVAFSRDGKYFASAGQVERTVYRGMVLYGDAVTGKLIRAFKTGGRTILSMKFMNHDQWLLIGEQLTGMVNAIDLTGKVQRTYSGHSGNINSVEAFKKTDRVLSAGSDGGLRIWNATTQIPARIINTGSGMADACVSPGEKWLVSIHRTYADSKFQIWDGSNGTLVQSCSAYPAMVETAACAPTNNTVLGGYSDGIARLWLMPRANGVHAQWTNFP